MKKSRFTETQIIAILKEGEAGSKVKGICRSHEISDATNYNWKSKHGGMQATDLNRMKDFNKTYRTDVLNLYLFRDLEEFREITY